jgi:hypothetical protein
MTDVMNSPDDPQLVRQGCGISYESAPVGKDFLGLSHNGRPGYQLTYAPAL